MGDSIDLVCWDWGDTLVDELFMQIAPAGCAEWTEVYAQVSIDHSELFDEMFSGRESMNALVEILHSRLPSLGRRAIARHIRAVWHQIVWFPETRAWVERLRNADVVQAIVTVNPHEFHGMAVTCGVDLLVDVIVTSAELADFSKPVMAKRARELLGLSPGLGSTLLIDNKHHNTAAFVEAGGQAIHYTPATFAREAEHHLGPLVTAG